MYEERGTLWRLLWSTLNLIMSQYWACKTYRSPGNIESRRPWSFAAIEVILVLRCWGERGMAGRCSDHQEERWWFCSLLLEKSHCLLFLHKIEKGNTDYGVELTNNVLEWSFVWVLIILKKIYIICDKHHHHPGLFHPSTSYCCI